jgi:type I restriction enzyme S subunit
MQLREREVQDVELVRATVARFGEAPTPGNLDFLFSPSYTIDPANLRKIILALAVQGKLVPQDPNDEPAKLSFPDLAKAAINTPDNAFPANWFPVSLGSVGEWRGGGTPSKTRAEFWEGVIPWVSPKDMKTFHISDSQDHISNIAVGESSVRMVPERALLMVVRGMILARAFPVALTTRTVTINQDMKSLIPLHDETAEFLLLALRALEPVVLAAIERSTHGTCKLETDVLHAFTVPIPPLAEQHRIIAKFDQLMALVDQLEIQLTESRATSEKLMHAVVLELTSQD